MEKAKIITIPVDGLFIYKKQVWRSLSKLIDDSHSVTAQKVKINKYGTEVVVGTADFIETLLVESYDGEVPTLGENEMAGSASQYQVTKNYKED